MRATAIIHTYMLLCITFLCGITLTAQNQQKTEANAILGKWITEDSLNVIEIYKEGDKFYGKIIWISPNSALFDINNKDESQRSNFLRGTDVISELSFNGTEWTGGSFYNKDSGTDYPCRMWLSENGCLALKEYWGFLWWGEKKEWQRPPQNHEVYRPRYTSPRF